LGFDPEAKTPAVAKGLGRADRGFSSTAISVNAVSNHATGETAVGTARYREKAAWTRILCLLAGTCGEVCNGPVVPEHRFGGDRGPTHGTIAYNLSPLT